MKEYSKVKTKIEKEGYPAGMTGVIVSFYSNGPACEVELWDESNYPVDVVTYLTEELEECSESENIADESTRFVPGGNKK